MPTVKTGRPVAGSAYRPRKSPIRPTTRCGISTGLPKPVYITTRSFMVQTAAIIDVCSLSADCDVAGSLQLSTHYGLGQALFLPSVLGSTLGLV